MSTGGVEEFDGAAVADFAAVARLELVFLWSCPRFNFPNIS